MKKILILLLTTVLVTSCFIGCGSDSQKTKNNETKTETSKEEETKPKKDEVKTISDGQTINNESFDLTLNKVELTYDVLPDDTGNFYTHYPADQGKVYINIDVDIKNNQKQDLRCDKILTVEANYNNGYTYNANSIVEDSKTGFTYSNITSITPLETKGMRYLINCPEEVEQSQNSLFLTFNLNGEKYKYVIR